MKSDKHAIVCAFTKDRNLILGIILLILASLMPALAKETIEITFVGEVEKPSRVTVAPEGTFESALKSAGPTVWATSKRFIRIRVEQKPHDGGPPKTIHESREIPVLSGDLSLSKLGIKHGDVIYVCQKRPMGPG